MKAVRFRRTSPPLRTAVTAVLVAAAVGILVAAPRGTQAGAGLRATGAIAGRVTVAGDRGPARRAIVSIAGPAFPSGALATTDDEGRYLFADVPAGRYTLSVSKAGLVSAHHGSTRPGRGPGLPIEVRDALVRADLEMLPGAIIFGLLRDHSGEPRSMGVTAFERRVVNGEVVWLAVRSGTTEATGEFRIAGLAPGTYLVSASPGALYAGARVPADAEFAAAARGELLPLSGPSAPRRQNVVYVPTFFPGVTDASQAAPIVIGVGEERNIEITAQLAPSARVTARVVDPSGGPPRGLRLNLVTPQHRIGSDYRDLTGAVRPLSVAAAADGTFEAQALAPGRYTFLARADGAATASQWAIADLAVAGADISDFVIRLEHGLVASGRVAFDVAPGTAPPDPYRLQVRLTTLGGVGLGTAPRRVEADGTFAVTGLAGGNYRIDVIGGGWTLLSARSAGGAELLDRGLTLAAGRNAADLVLTLTDRAPAVAGRIVGAEGAPVTSCSIVLIAADSALWQSQSRRTRVARPRQDGAYEIEGLPPGEYHLAAVSDADGFEIGDPGVFETIAAAGVRIRLSDHERLRLDLRIGEGR